MSTSTYPFHPAGARLRPFNPSAVVLQMSGTEPTAGTPTADLHRPAPPQPPVDATKSPGDAAQRPTGWGWTPLRIVGVVLGSVLVLQSLGMLLGGAGALWVDRGLRDDAGYLTSDTQSLNTDGYALSTENIAIETAGLDVPDLLMGDVRIRATGSDGDPLFIGIAPTAEAEQYLQGVRATTIVDFDDDNQAYRQVEGGAPANPPAQEDIWTAQSSGAGTQSLEWEIEDGDWTVVVMNADAGADIDARADIGATVPMLGWLAAVLLVGGGLLLLVGIVLIVASVPRSGIAAAAERT